MPKPTRTLNPLHFEDLEPHRFEDLTRQLIHDFRQWRTIEAPGRTGSEGGMDIRAIEAASKEFDTDRDTELGDRVWVIQCKREARIGPKRVREIVSDNLSDLKEPVHGYILVAACDFSKSARDAFNDECAKYGLGEYYIWGKAEIEDKLFQPKNNHLLVAYFGISLQASKGNPLIEILTRMHDRMTYLKDIRLEQRFARKRFQDACPLFFARLGLVKEGEWDTYEKRIAKRIKHHVPKSPKKKAEVMWRYKVVGEVKEIVRELVNSRVWQIDDLVKAGNHLDSIHMGLGELRDKDEQWQTLFKMVRPYTTDSILRGLVDKYISHSYAFCSNLLLISYGNRLPKHEFGRMLCSALTSGDISPDKIEIALGEILEDITKRLRILDESHPLYQSIAVKPSTGKREADYERTEHRMWAELQVTNMGANELKDVQVNITKCLTLQANQDSVNRNDFAMWNQLGIKPFSIYWSERQAQSKQMNLVIPIGATRSALVAFQDNPNGGQFNFNSLNYEWIVGGAKIDVEISSHEAVLWNGEFYIECHPNYLGGERAKFDFMEWNTWVKDKNITQLNSNRQGYK